MSGSIHHWKKRLMIFVGKQHCKLSWKFKLRTVHMNLYAAQKCIRVIILSHIHKRTITLTHTRTRSPERGSCLREAIKCAVARSNLSLLIAPPQSDQNTHTHTWLSILVRTLIDKMHSLTLTIKIPNPYPLSNLNLILTKSPHNA